MTLADNLKEARLSKNMSQEELANLIGKSKNVISNWERGDNKPDADTIFSLCDILNVDANYLLGWDSNDSFAISLSEQSLIKKYRSLDGYGRKTISSLLDLEYERCNATVEEDTVQYITKPYYAIGASAGTGQYLFDDLERGVISLPDNQLNNKADMVIDVKGSSMEPTYKSGDKLLVKKQDTLNVSDIGIFIINGESFVKELGVDRLISHNKQYQDIYIHDQDNITVVGKVIGII